MTKKKLLDFTGTRISDVKQINPLFSTCKVRIMYTGINRNYSSISKGAVEQALPSLTGVPIVGEFSMDAKDFKGHGGTIDMDSYDFIHTTKPYGFVPESATVDWEQVRGKDGSTREYLTVDGCYLWTGRYPEAFSIIENGKGQSMEIEVTDGDWNDETEVYDIKGFNFSALCVLGDDVEPAFEDANVTASFSLDSDVFKLEYSKMMQDVKQTLLQEKEDNEMLKELLAKYSTTMEALTAKGLDFSAISEDDLEAEIAKALEVEVITDAEPEVVEPEVTDEPEVVEPEATENPEIADVEPEVVEPEVTDAIVDTEPEAVEPEVVEPEVVEPSVDVEALQSRVTQLEGELASATTELDSLREFKLNIEKADHEAKAQKLFNDFQLTGDEVKDLDIHKFSVEEIEAKCYEILGRKIAKNKNFSRQNKGIHLPLNDTDDAPTNLNYGGLLKKSNK